MAVLPEVQAQVSVARPKHRAEKPVKGHKVGVRPRKKDPATQGDQKPGPVKWPQAGTAEVVVPDAQAAEKKAASQHAAANRAGKLPVWVTAPQVATGSGGVRQAQSSAVGKVRVQMLDRSTAKRLGTGDVTFTVARADASMVAGQVGVRIDYSGFAHAFGGSYQSRLQLVQFPGCVLTTPQLPQCRTRTPVASQNDGRNLTLSGQVSIEPADPTAVQRQGSLRTAQKGTSVLALTSGPSSSSGDYQATSLSPSSTWNVGLQTGGFSWSYPIDMPPVPGGLSPSLSIGYGSGGVDGKTANTNGQASDTGEGFALQSSFIERSYKSCEDDGVPKHPTKGVFPGDRCWGYHNATMSFGGHSGELVPDSDGKWHLKDDDGTRIEKLADVDTKNGDNDGEYWKVTTTDGTRYYFGLNRPDTNKWSSGTPSGASETNSTWTVPVFGNDEDEPCHKSSGFADSWCQQAYRWNLDQVIDPHGNAAVYYYKAETNRYGRNITFEDDTPYVRAGYIDHIDYGLRTGNLWPTTHVPARVSFEMSERCIGDASFDCAEDKIAGHPEYWRDVPWDQNCNAGQECRDEHGGIGPTFWTRKMLTKITTQIWNDAASTPAYKNVDSWSLGYRWGEADHDSALLLQSIQHTGLAGATPVILPPVTFNHVQLDNRIKGVRTDILPYTKYRLGAIYDEVGGQIDINYSDVDCSASSLPTPETNKRRCFPTYWQPPGKDKPIEDWFHKYVVTKVIRSDRTGQAPNMVTGYDYKDGAAWHYDDDDGLTKQKYKSWTQWRGYGRVIEQSGGLDGMTSQTEHLYMRGMDGDRKNADGGSKDVTVSTGEPGDDQISDDLAFEGFELKTTRYSKPNGDPLEKAVNLPWKHQTAKRVRDWGTVTANLTGTATSRGLTAKSDGTWRKTQVDTTYDTTNGQTLEVDNQGDVAVNGDESCSTTTYSSNTDDWKLSYPVVKKTIALRCGKNVTDYTKQLISTERLYYDGSNTLGADPGSGSVTRTDKVSTATTATELKYVVSAKATYDDYGRVRDATIVDNSGTPVDRVTTTTYTNSPAGLTTGTSTTTPPAIPADATTSLTTSKVIDPATGLPTREIDAAEKKTDLVYDALGRLTKVWLPNRSKANQTPNIEYLYQISSSAISAIGTKRLRKDGTYATGWSLYDGFLRPRQTQTPGPAGGRLLSDTFYNPQGQAWLKYSTYYDDEKSPEPVLFGVGASPNVETQLRSSYDGLGRVVNQKTISGTGDAPVLAQTSIEYGGDWVAVTPPQGAGPTLTFHDAQGRTSQLRQFNSGQPTLANTDYVSTKYTFSAAGQADSVAGPLASNSAGPAKTWSYEYDVRGRKVSEADPDKGTSSYTYNDLNQLTQSRDARGSKIGYSYDNLGRKTAEYDATSANPGTKLADWTYDTLRKGSLTSSTRHAGGKDYTTAVGIYDALGRPTRTTIKIPAGTTGEGALGGDYEFNTAYNLDGTIQSVGLPAAGGLPTEVVVNGYDELGRATKLDGTLGTYVTRTDYSFTGKPMEYELSAGGTTKKTQLKYFYEWGTQRLQEAITAHEGAGGADRDAVYRYDPAGNVRQITDTSRSGIDNQCFRQDGLGRLTDAWTPAVGPDHDITCGDPATATIGGPAGYRLSYTYDTEGNRSTETHYDSAGVQTAKRDYKYAGDIGVADTFKGHQLATVAQTGASPYSGAARTETYGYDASGNTTTRTIGGTTQTMRWDATGKLDQVTEKTSGQPDKNTSYVYDTSGNRLISHDSDGGATLYLPGTQVRLAKNATTPTATRYYSHNGATIALRTSAGVTFLSADAHGTNETAITASATPVLSQRRFTPFGQNRGASTGTWPTSDQRAFVGGVTNFASGGTNAPGLTHLGAREYDTNTGRFISVDPLIDTDDPQQMNGYTYAHNDPVTRSDPTGLSDDCATHPGSNGCPGPKRGGTGAAAAEAGAGAAGGDGGGSGGGGGDGTGGNGDGLLNGCTPNQAYANPKACSNADNPYLRNLAAKAPPPPEAKINWPATIKFTAIFFSLLLGPEDIAIGAALKGFTWGLRFRRVRNTVKKLGDASDDVANAGKRPRNTKPPSEPTPKAPQDPAPARKPSTAKCSSFVPGTRVLMANGRTKPIQNVKAGDKVVTTDPKTGKTQPKTVLAPITSAGSKTLVDIHLKTNPTEPATDQAVTATDTHPFWVAGDIKQWVEAKALKPGMWLRTSAGTYAQVAALHSHTTQLQRVHNLTIQAPHTYYALLGPTPILVHNCGPDGGRYGRLQPAGPGNEIHHAPQNASTPLSSYSGPAIRMARADHRQLYSTGSSLPSRAWLQMQRELVDAGRIDQAMQNEIDDVVARFPGVYNNAIGDMIGDLASNPAYQAQRLVPEQVYVQLSLF